MAKTSDSSALVALAQGLSALTEHLVPEDALATLTHAMGRTADPSAMRALAEGLSRLATRLEAKDAARPAGILMQAVARTTDPYARGVVAHGHAVAIPPLFLLAFVALPEPLPTPDLVELLKHPTCVGMARRVILDQLENRYHHKFADHWAFVRFAKEQKLGLDFTSPPKRPARQ
jgi:hypothetical protein